MNFGQSDLAVAMTGALLRNWSGNYWTTMGFGMIRTYLDPAKRFRFNIWDDRLEVTNVSRIHNHPWGFTSYILAGSITNYRYIIAEGRPTHDAVQIVTGEEGGMRKHLPPVRLVQASRLECRRGGWYHQEASELHETDYQRGTVSINDRTEPSADHTATVLFPVGGSWVDAKPREATKTEIYAAVTAAQELFKKEARGDA